MVALLAFLQRSDCGLALGYILHHAEAGNQGIAIIEDTLYKLAQMPDFPLAVDNSVIEVTTDTGFQVTAVDSFTEIGQIIGMDDALEIRLSAEFVFEFLDIGPINRGHLVRIKICLVFDLIPFPDAKLQHFGQFPRAMIAKFDCRLRFVQFDA